MFGNFEIADYVAYVCAAVDVHCRGELEQGILVSERDYVTALTKGIRDRLTLLHHFTCHAQSLPAGPEKEHGVDGIVVFRSGNEIKAGLFEAKRPKLSEQNYQWDVLTKRDTSHFSEQINKQKQWNGVLALWEMFFNEGQAGFLSPPFDYFGSSCVWHAAAIDFMSRQRLTFAPWTTPRLIKLIEWHGVNFYSIIYDLITCRAGKAFAIDPNGRTAEVYTANQIGMTIPIPRQPTGEPNEAVNGFMLKNRIDSFLYVDLSRGRDPLL